MPEKGTLAARGREEIMKVFEGPRQQQAFLRWWNANPRGYVLNSYVPADPSYLIIHRVGCWTLQRNIDAGHQMTKYGKRCSIHPAVLLRFARSIGGSAWECIHCFGH